MADDKTKTGKEDDNLISFKQKYEVDYAVRQLQKKAPEATKKEVKEALFQAARETAPSEGRQKIMNKAERALKKK